MYGAALAAENIGFSLTVPVTGAITGVVREGVLGNIKGRIFDVLLGGGWVVLNGFGFCTGNLIGSETFNIFAFQRKFCRARATVTCSCSSIFALSDDEPSDCCTTGKTYNKNFVRCEKIHQRLITNTVCLVEPAPRFPLSHL